MWVWLRTMEWYNWVHWIIALLGNIAFLIGSILYLEGSMQHVGTWFFAGGATGMLVGRIGSTIMEMEYKHLHYQWQQVKDDIRGRGNSNS